MTLPKPHLNADTASVSGESEDEHTMATSFHFDETSFEQLLSEKTTRISSCTTPSTTNHLDKLIFHAASRLPPLPKITSQGSADRVRDKSIPALKNDLPISEDNNSSTDSDNNDEESSYFAKDEATELITKQLGDSFTQMNLCKPLVMTLAEMGLIKPTPIQQSAIPLALMGKDICGGAETGSGKTAAFLIPIMERLWRAGVSRTPRTRILILLPTRELAVQCHQVALKMSSKSSSEITICLAAGGMHLKEQASKLRTRPDIVIGTPGRIVDHLKNTPDFTLNFLEILILDEADRMLEQGFEAELNEIVHQCPRQRQTLLFSASMTENVSKLARVSLKHPIKLFVDGKRAIAHLLEQQFVRVRDEERIDRVALLICLIDRLLVSANTRTEEANVNCSKKAIVFLPTRELAHRLRLSLGLFMRSDGGRGQLSIMELHGSMDQASRLASLDAFRKAPIDAHAIPSLLVSTDVAARGLDIPSVDLVLMYSMPVNYNQYLHRVGRTARAGRPGLSVTIVGEGDRRMLKQVIKHSSAPVKQRTISTLVLTSYIQIMQTLEPELARLLKEEHEARLLEKAEKELTRANNLIEHAHEIATRPPRQWLKKMDKKRKGDDLAQSKGLNDEKLRKKPTTKTRQKRTIQEGESAPTKAKRRSHRTLLDDYE